MASEKKRRKVAVFNIHGTVWIDADSDLDPGDPPVSAFEGPVKQAIRVQYADGDYRGEDDPITVNVDVVRTDD